MSNNTVLSRRYAEFNRVRCLLFFRMIYDLDEQGRRRASAVNKRQDLLLRSKLEQLDRHQKVIQKELLRIRHTRSGLTEELAAQKRAIVGSQEQQYSALEVRRSKPNKECSGGAKRTEAGARMSECGTMAHQSKIKEELGDTKRTEVAAKMPERNATVQRNKNISHRELPTEPGTCLRFVRRHSVVPLTSHDPNTWPPREASWNTNSPDVTTNPGPLKNNVRFVRRHSLVPLTSHDTNTWSSRGGPRRGSSPDVMTELRPEQNDLPPLRSAREKTRRASVATVGEFRTSPTKLHQDSLTDARITSRFRQLGHATIGMAIQNRARRHSVSLGGTRRHSVTGACRLPGVDSHGARVAREDEAANFGDQELALQTEMLLDLEEENGESSLGGALPALRCSRPVRRHSTTSVLGEADAGPNSDIHIPYWPFTKQLPQIPRATVTKSKHNFRTGTWRFAGTRRPVF